VLVVRVDECPVEIEERGRRDLAQLDVWSRTGLLSSDITTPFGSLALAICPNALPENTGSPLIATYTDGDSRVAMPAGSQTPPVGHKQKSGVFRRLRARPGRPW
jgi:hypothetical protein